MTSNDIRTQVSPMVIWMADAAIREARKAITGNTGWNDVKRNPFNLPEVEMAGEILFRMFDTFTTAIRDALIEMPEKMDGVWSFPDCNYFDEFVKALDKKLHWFSDPEEVELRKPDWILESL